jgi:hypothetical protein
MSLKQGDDSPDAPQEETILREFLQEIEEAEWNEKWAETLNSSHSLSWMVFC